MKLVVVGGGGGVGASVAFNVLLGARTTEVVLVDSSAAQVESHAMDFAQVLEQSPGSSLRAGTECDLVDADVVVVTASVPLAINRSRLVYLEANAKILNGVADALPPDWPGVAILVTNPVDPLVTCSGREPGSTGAASSATPSTTACACAPASRAPLARTRRRCGVGARRARRDGRSDLEPCGGRRRGADPRATRRRRVAEEYLRTWYVRHVALDSGRTSTWTTGLGVAGMVEAIREDANDVWPASLVLDGEYGLAGVAVTVPVRLGAEGAAPVLEWPLEAGELEALHASPRSSGSPSKLCCGLSRLERHKVTRVGRRPRGHDHASTSSNNPAF